MAFSRGFGSARAFALTTGLVLVWLAAMPWLGVSNWNSSLGLAGNTIESTVELFLAIAVQYTANRVEKTQTDNIEAIRDLESLIADDVKEELALLRQLIAEKGVDTSGK